MIKQLKYILLISICGTLLFSAATYKKDFFEIAKQIEIFTTLFKELNMNYVDEINPAELMDTAIKNMLSDLDPYTQFYNEQDVEAELIRRTGDYTGIGAQIKILKDKLLVIEPYKNYPADKAGLKAGDEILTVNGINVSNFNSDISVLLRGSSGTTLPVTYKRQDKTFNTTITLQEVEIDAVPFYSMVNKTTGYIVLRRFNNKATQQTQNAINQLKAEGATRLILDLRNNPGGLLHEAINVVNLFIPQNQLVVTTKSEIKKYNNTYYTKNPPLDTEIPLVVLINDKSASASEIVSGSLQDLDRAVIVGTRSFGKGLVQRPKQLTYGTQLKVTISRYYTPSGRSIQALDYKNGLATRFKDSLRKKFKTTSGRIVYSSGGILPDEQIYTAQNSPLIKTLENTNLIFDYATEYYYKNPNLNVDSFKLTDSDFKDFQAFLKSKKFSFITETETALETVLKEAEKEGIEASIKNEYTNLVNAISASKKTSVIENKTEILNLLTNEIVKRYVYAQGLYNYYLTHNVALQKATSILNNPTVYQDYLKP